MEIKANKKSVCELKDFYFSVPNYQREYVWKADDQVEQFLVDIDNEYEEDSKEQQSYFIGSIIIVKNNEGKYDVIDGQQRLTTIMLTLCAMRDLLEEQNLDKKQKQYLKTIQELLYDFDTRTDQEEIRLELQYDESKGFLSHLILQTEYEDEKTASIQKMLDAHRTIKAHLNKYLEKGCDVLVSYIRYFINHIDLVIIESENIGSALKIFETINQRGVSLNAMDLVKNLLFSKANEKDFEKIKDTWKKITALLQSCGEDENPLRFLRYFMMARYHDGILREDDIYKWIISPSGKKSLKYESNPLDLVTEIQFIAQRYAHLVNATKSINPNYADKSSFPNVTNIGFINKYKARQHLVLLLALGKKTQDKELNYLAKQLESFYFFSNTLGIQSKNNERLFTMWAREFRGKVTEAEITQTVAVTILPYIKEKYDEFKHVFLNIRHGSYNPQYRQRFILGRLENQARIESGLTPLSHKQVQAYEIEHILPQTPKDGILTPEFMDKASYHNSVYKLGNVTLIESVINQAVNRMNDLNGDWFASKCDEYIKSDVLTTNLINDDYAIGKNTAINRFKEASAYSFKLWDSLAVSKRQEILLDLALNIWKVCGQRIDS